MSERLDRWTSPRARGAATVFFGIVVPLGCLMMETGNWMNPRVLLTTQVFVGIEVIALALWLTMKRPAAFLGGLFAAGAVVAAPVGMFLAVLAGPLLLGFALTGNHDASDALFDGARALLCFATPVTAYVYARNGLRAWERPTDGSLIGTTALAFAGFLLAFAIPSGAHEFVRFKIDSGFRELYASTSESEAEAIDRLRPYRRYVLRREFVLKYRREQDPVRKAKLAVAYRHLKGGNIERADDSASD